MSITDLLTPPQDTNRPGAVGSFVLGTVAENNSDEFPGMVKVAFTAWTEGENISKWLPVLTPYAGPGYGCYLIPEIDDIVLVGFIGPMLEQPFVMGSFFPMGAALPGEQYDEKNTSRHFKTKGGVSLTVKDDDGKQSVSVETPQGLKLLMEDESGSITVTDGANSLKLDAKAGAAELTADKKITLKAGSCEISMDGTGGSLGIKGGQLSLEGSQTAALKSSNMLTVDGGMTTVEGKQTLTLKGSAMCEISGGMVKIN